MNNKGAFFLKIGVTLIALIFILYQTYSIVYKPITTATAVYHNTYDGIEVNGYFVREETVIDHTITGSERYVVEEGEKVSKDGVIAEVYASTEVAEAYQKVDELTEEIKMLESINSVSDPSSVDLNTLSNRIERSYIELLSLKDSNKYGNLNNAVSDLLMLLNKKQILTGEVSGFDTLLATLKNELDTVKTSLTAPLSNVTTPVSGFFIRQSDGLENVLTFDMLENVDETIFEKIANATPKNAFGKIVSSQNFYIITKMENDDYLKFSVGDSIDLRTTIVGSEKIKANIHSIKVSETSNSAIVVLSCQTMNGQFAAIRSTPLTIVTEEYEGIRVSNSAVHYSEGVAGVYVVQGSLIKFKPIEIVYRTKTFTICKKAEDGNTNSLSLYDEVVEKGKNLYDGKFIG